MSLQMDLHSVAPPNARSIFQVNSASISSVSALPEPNAATAFLLSAWQRGRLLAGFVALFGERRLAKILK